MPRYEDLTGQKFGKLTAIEATDKKIDGRRVWKCLCECGNTHYTTNRSLKRGDCKSCGCLNKAQITALGKDNAKDITNKRFGKLIAIEKLNEKFSWSSSCVWLCKCDCGNEIKVTVSSLNSKNTQSCGCQQHSLGVENIKSRLQEFNISYTTEKTYLDLRSDKNKLLQFDFYLPEKNTLIEFDGEQHYKRNRYFTNRQIFHDFLKNEYSLKNNIPLYRIPYSEKNNILLWSLDDFFQEGYLVKQINHYEVDV